MCRYLEGGVDTGFKHVDRDAYRKRLLHVKGKRNVRIVEVSINRVFDHVREGGYQNIIFMINWVTSNAFKKALYHRVRLLGLLRILRTMWDSMV